MNFHTFLLMAASIEAQHASAEWSRRRDERPYPEVMPYALRRPCPRCGAAVGAPCNPATLGRHDYHLARVKAR